MKPLILMLLMLPMIAEAESQPWMKKKDPNELVLFLKVGEECPFTFDEGWNIVSGVLTRARIKTLIRELNVSYPPPFFQVLVACTSVGTDGYIYNLEIDFVGPAQTHDKTYYLARWGSYGSGVYGQGSSANVRQVLRNKVEDAITDYLGANFDLGEDE